jgi:hypothetical protein
MNLFDQSRQGKPFSVKIPEGREFIVAAIWKVPGGVVFGLPGWNDPLFFGKQFAIAEGEVTGDFPTWKVKTPEGDFEFNALLPGMPLLEQWQDYQVALAGADWINTDQPPEKIYDVGRQSALDHYGLKD